MAGQNEIVFPLTFVSDRVYILSEQNHLETNLFEVFPLAESSDRFLTEELQDRVKTEVHIYASDVPALKINKYTPNLSKLEEIFACRIRKRGTQSEIPNPRNRGKIICGNRIKLKQLDGFMWHWKNHQVDRKALVEKWRESFQSDLKDAIETHLDTARQELKKVETIEVKEEEGEKEYIVFAQFVDTFFNGVDKAVREMLKPSRDQAFVATQLENLKLFQEQAKEYWIELKVQEKDELDGVCLQILNTFHRDCEQDEWGDFLGPEGNFLPYLLELDETADDYFSFLICHNLLTKMTNYLHGKITLLRRMLSEEQEKSSGLSENLQTKMEHEMNMATLLEEYKKENEELKKELNEKKISMNRHELRLSELKNQVENLASQKKGLEKEVEFKNKVLQFEIEKKDRDLIEKNSKIEELTGQLTLREKEFNELKENTLLVGGDMESVALTSETLLIKEKDNRELTDNIWETYKRTSENFTKMDKLVRDLNGKFEEHSETLFAQVNQMRENKTDALLTRIFEAQSSQLLDFEKKLNAKDEQFEAIRQKLSELLSEVERSGVSQNNVKRNEKAEEEKAALVDKLNTKERVITTLNSTMKKMLEHINEFTREKGELKDNLEQYIALNANLVLLREKCWKDDRKFQKYKSNTRILSKSKKDILAYVYKKCKKGFFG